jgi:GAF domain-containing protein
MDDIFSVAGEVSKQLLASGFTPAAIGDTLRKVGGALRVDRVYIFENGINASGALCCSQRFEWSAASVSAQIDNPELQDLAYSDFGSIWVELLSNDRELCGPTRTMDASTRAVLEAQDVKSILVCPITLGDKWWGFVGFDDCHRERSWAHEEIAVLKMLARALGGALRQGKLRQVLLDARSQLESVAKRFGQTNK